MMLVHSSILVWCLYICRGCSGFLTFGLALNGLQRKWGNLKTISDDITWEVDGKKLRCWDPTSVRRPGDYQLCATGLISSGSLWPWTIGIATNSKRTANFLCRTQLDEKWVPNHWTHLDPFVGTFSPFVSAEMRSQIQLVQPLRCRGVQQRAMFVVAPSWNLGQACCHYHKDGAWLIIVNNGGKQYSIIIDNDWQEGIRSDDKQQWRLITLFTVLPKSCFGLCSAWLELTGIS